MCGIFCLLNNNHLSVSFINKQFIKGVGRGPESSILNEDFHDKCIFGFHRLAINGLNNISNQPIIINNILLICNGEIYNYKELYKMMNMKNITDSDCEIIIHLYRKYGIEQTLQMIDGVFSFILCDLSLKKLYVARDPFGVRPLYVLTNDIYINFASELKMLSEFKGDIKHFTPGSYSIYDYKNIWKLYVENKIYHTTSFPCIGNVENVYHNIQNYLTNAVKKRVFVSDRPIACLLSGGLDSSLITALVNEYYHKDHKLQTFSIGMHGSDDLKNARIVSEYLNTEHYEILLTEDDFFNAIPEVIKAIESYDTTTVRASIGNYLVGKYISENSEAKVIFNGDGSDELCGGYLYMHLVPDSVEFDKESRRLLKDIHLFDVLRSDKCISSHGLEPRTPFLDRSWTQYYLSIDPDLRNHTLNKNCEKFLLRNAFSTKHFKNKNNNALLPDCILYRRKEAFSDAVSHIDRSLYKIIQEKVKEKYNMSETEYYKHLFNKYYPDRENIVPYFWNHQYVESKDPSARTLNIYYNA
jgi:asparagine synthase (glutamine-hydrolysing)